MFHFLRTHNSHRGVTLIEVIVAATVFVVALGAMLTSAIALFTATTFSANFLVATNLAREAVEVVRNKRDTNFQNGLSFRDGFDFDQGIIKLQFFGGVFSGIFAVEETTETIDECTSGTRDCVIYYDVLTGLYGDPSLAFFSNGEVTKYFRTVSFAPVVCENLGTALADGLCTAGEEVAVRVTADVKWFQGSATRQLAIETVLFNWQ